MPKITVFVSKLCDGCPPPAVPQFSWIELCRAHVEYSKAALKLWKFSSHWPTVKLIIQLTWMDYTSDLRVTVKFPDWILPGLKMYIFWFTQLFENLAQQQNCAPKRKLHSMPSKNKMIKLCTVKLTLIIIRYSKSWKFNTGPQLDLNDASV